MPKSTPNLAIAFVALAFLVKALVVFEKPWYVWPMLVTAAVAVALITYWDVKHLH